mgnify:FL=1
MRRLPLLLVWLFLLGATALGSEKVQVRVAGLGIGANMSPGGIAETRVIAEFKRRYPHIELVPATGLRIEGVGDEVLPLMMIAAGISPDVLHVNFRRIDSYVRQGFLYPLDEFIAQEEARDPNWKQKRIVSQVDRVARRPGRDGKEHYYAIPIEYSVMGLYYNRPLFREVGLPERAPKDWDEMVEFAKKINAADPRNKGLVLGSGQQAAWNLMNFLWSTGAEAVEEVAPNEWRAVFNSKEALQAFEFYYRLTEGEGIATRGDLSQLTSGANGRRVGMQFSYIGNRVAMDPAIWGFGAVPAGPTGIRGAEINASMLGIFSGVKDPRVREAAWKYIEFMGSETAQKIRTDTFVEMGQVNQINPAHLRKFGYTAFLGLAEPGLEEEFELAVKTAKPEPYGKNCNLIYVEMTYPLDEILLSKKVAEYWKKGEFEKARAEMKRILDRAVELTNERMLGVIPREEMTKRRIVASFVLAGIVGAFVYVGRVIMRTFREVGGATQRVRGIQKYYAWGFLLIPLVLTLVWNYIPVARGAVMAVLDYQIILKSTFVGIDNFANVLFDHRFWRSLWATLHFAFWLLTVGFAAPIILAYLLHLTPKGKLFFRVLYYLPSLLSGAALYVLWKQFFSRNGMINEFLAAFGIEISRAWVDDPFLAMLACVIPSVWAGVGPGCLIYLAALKTIPEEQFESAEIDGAGFWGKTVHIVFPGLKPLIVINFVGAVAGAFHSSQNVLIMTGGGPNGATEVASLRLFYEAFMFLNFGSATAMAWILGAMLIGFTLVQLRRLSRMEFKSAGG